MTRSEAEIQVRERWERLGLEPLNFPNVFGMDAMNLDGMNNFGNTRRGGFWGPLSPLLHPIRWHRACAAHDKICNIYNYLNEQRPKNIEALNVVYEKTWECLKDAMDWLG